jgi:hypothetical protein
MGETFSNLWQRVSILVAFLTAWCRAADTFFLCQEANVFIFKLQAMSCGLGHCVVPEASGSTIASLVMVILTL